LIETSWYEHGLRRDEYEARPQTAPPLWRSHMPIVEGDEVSNDRTQQPLGEIDMNSSKTLTAISAGLALSTAGTTFASTKQDSPEPHVVIRYTDAELTTDQGVRHVLQRIRAAVEQVCPAVDSRELARYAQVEACRTQAITRAAAQVKSARLAAALAVSTRQG
jgi:UrcA family protein